jgi:hypothetical protein
LSRYWIGCTLLPLLPALMRPPLPLRLLLLLLLLPLPLPLPLPLRSPLLALHKAAIQPFLVEELTHMVRRATRHTRSIMFGSFCFSYLSTRSPFRTVTTFARGTARLAALRVER